MVAGGDVAATVFDQRRLVGAADLGRVAAARMEAAAGGRGDRAGHIADQDDPLPPLDTSGSGIGTAESSASVYGCTGLW